MDGNTNISDLIGNVLSDPEKMKTVMSILPALTGISDSNSNSPPPQPQSQPQATPNTKLTPDDLYNDPRVSAALKNLISVLIDAVPLTVTDESSVVPDKPLAGDAVNASAIGGILSMMGSQKSPSTDANDGDSSDEHSPSDEKIEKALSSLKNFTSATNPEQDARMKLLLSLKPFLRDSRKTKIDTAMKYMSAAKILNLFGKNGFV